VIKVSFLNGEHKGFLGLSGANATTMPLVGHSTQILLRFGDRLIPGTVVNSISEIRDHNQQDLVDHQRNRRLQSK
jgi:hypothetical protein